MSKGTDKFVSENRASFSAGLVPGFTATIRNDFYLYSFCFKFRSYYCDWDMVSVKLNIVYLFIAYEPSATHKK